MTSDILQGKRRRLTENQGAENEDEVAADERDSPPQSEIAALSEAVPAQTVVFHVDLDCFYVSVAVRDNPALAGKPVVVCPASKFTGTSEIASASYEARALGIKSRMHVGEARKLCPALICVPCNYPEYEKVSLQMYEIFTRHTNRVLAVSADEAYLDMSAFPDPIRAADALRKDILSSTGCSASIGIGHNLLLARVATKKAKPNGVFHITRGNFFDYLAECDVKDLPGFGPATMERLKERSISTVRALRALSKEVLQNEFGKKHGEMMWNYARGVDDRVIGVQQHTRKSVGTQISWGVRFQEIAQLERFLFDVATEVQRRMRELGAKGRRINVRIKKRAPDAAEPAKLFNPGKHAVVHKSVTLAQPTDDAAVIARECMRMFKQTRIPVTDFRGLGLSIDQLDRPRQQTKERDRRVRTLDDMLQKAPQPQPQRAQSGTAASGSSSGGSGGENADMADVSDFANPSSDGPPSSTLSPEEAAREAELLRDRQASPDLYEHTPPSPQRMEHLDELPRQHGEQSASTPEELRNVVVATEQHEVLDLTLSPPSDDYERATTPQSPVGAASTAPPVIVIPDALPLTMTGRNNNNNNNKKAAVASVAAPSTAQGRGRGRQQQQQRFRQLKLSAFTSADKKAL